MIEETEFNTKVEITVRELLAKVNRVPFLFIGSGISRRYMGTENWEGLLKWVCETAGRPMKQFYIYKQQALAECGEGDNELYPHIASLMERDFIQALDNDVLADWGRRHADDLENGIPAMKLYIADHLLDFRPVDDDVELMELKKASRHVAGVITTNYDRLMEEYVFPGYQTYCRQDDLLFSQLAGIGEIYKIHGSVDDPASMILDENDYKQLEERQQYLLSKILTIFGEYPIIFLGYSLKDQDIRGIITAIVSCAGECRMREMAERFIFIDYSPEQSIQTTNYDVNGKIVKMTSIGTQEFAPIYKAIAGTNMKYAPKVLRQITRQLYEAAYSGGDAQSVVFTNLENMDELPQNAEIVVGVGAKGYGRLVSSEDLYEDVLFGNKNLSVNLVIEEYLELYIPQGGVPMYYYLSGYGDGPLGEKTRGEIQDKRNFDDYLSKTQKAKREKWRKERRLSEWSIESLEREFGDRAYKNVFLLRQDEIAIDSLEQMVKKVAREMLESREKLDTDIRKDIRIYDFLKYGIPYLKKVSAPPHSSPSATPLS